ncbi:MAG: type II toxin-antitoxin system prevent-host-death family antitoxin [Planctomycetota bacterium]
MNSVPIHRLKQQLSQAIAAAEAGQTTWITKHGRIVARLAPVAPDLHLGDEFGRGSIAPALRGPTQGRYLDVIADDRRGGMADE